MRSFRLLPLLVLLPAIGWAKPAPVFYVCAHPDDCMLFMNPNLYDDTTQGAAKVVVVYLTSGDAGLPFSKDDDSAPYPYARERASIDATEWMADVDRQPVHTTSQTDVVTIHGHPIERVGYANTASYFLRLPDGNFDGNGFELYGNQSLRKLKSGDISRIAPIDGQVPYANWQELVGVLSGIIARESGDATDVTLHIQEPDTTKNIHDHSDHTTGASGVLEALAQEEAGDRCYRLYKHIDYSIAEKEPNLEGVGLQNKSGSFAVLTATQRRFLDHHNWDKAHLSYLTRNYYTTETLPAGCAIVK